MVIYIVMEGEYSGRHIVALYTDEIRARSLADLVMGDVEVHTTDPAQLDDIEQAMHHFFKAYHVEILASGDVVRVQQTEAPLDKAPCLPHLTSHEGVPALSLVCFARDEQHARKIANEQRTMYIASGRWDEEQPAVIADIQKRQRYWEEFRKAHPAGWPSHL